MRTPLDVLVMNTVSISIFSNLSAAGVSPMVPMLQENKPCSC